MPEEKKIHDNPKITMDVKINTADLAKSDIYQLRALGEYIDQIQRKNTDSKLGNVDRELSHIEKELKDLKLGEKRNTILAVFAFEASYIVAGITLMLTTAGTAKGIGEILGGLGVLAVFISAVYSVYKQVEIESRNPRS